ncbi:DUF3306 domain-containing protein [Ideonella paludis]|uniref:DUF3306 domain-containing protein n=1 Tax=Ideonella paludis TaxID=1233411 RepID=A0ABS5E1T4_9BURK|nr:DUF3306 domain-containing protein [Ideonella paludis]MBQ0937375.1 DUF3306 domain-containing protein [Ideonella paludis]
MSGEGQGFFSRWSQRKAEVRQAQAAQKAAPLPPAAADAAPVAQADSKPPATEPAPADAPTLADVQSLEPGQEVSRFMQRGVDPQVKNAAMKKLFADPHFNVMDGLDTYIDDYSQPDPIPQAMLRQLVQGEFLGLFAEEKAAEDAERQRLATAQAELQALATPSDHPPAPAPDAPDTPAAPAPIAQEPLHEDADLRLQQDPAAQPPSPEPSPGPDTRG